MNVMRTTSINWSSASLDVPIGGLVLTSKGEMHTYEQKTNG